MGEAGREVRYEDGVRYTYCTHHELKLRWMASGEGKMRMVCPDCEAGRPSKGETARKFPLIRFSQTWFRDRPLTDKEKQFKPKRHGDTPK